VWLIYTVHGLVPLAAASAATGWRADSLRPSDSWNTFSVDMTVSRRHLDVSGTAVGVPVPTTSYHIERSVRSGAWKTVVTVVAIDRAPLHALSGTLTPPGALPVARIEDDEDGTPVRAYDASGRSLTPFGASAGLPSATVNLPRSNGREWLEAFVATSAKKTLRLQTLERRFGHGARTGSWNRYARRDADLSEEVLVDSTTVVPVEVNHTRNGQRLVHRTFSYGAAPGDAVVRTAVHAEVPTTPDGPDRTVIDTAFSNIRLEQRR
jgi:hypothetical protein